MPISFDEKNLGYSQMPDAEEKNAICPGTLYLVATPIGNLADVSERAKKILAGVDFIAAEDTRNSAKLLNCLGITNSMVSYFEHNRAQRGPQILKRLQDGESCALISDAGTPAISDPGEDLVRLCAEKQISVTSVPGCCAAITALTLSGLSTVRFSFEGFLSGTHSEHLARLKQVCQDTRTLIFYEAPHRLLATLSDFFTVFGNRKIALCRELTKKNEEILRTTISEAVTYYETHTPRGEYVLIVEGIREEEQFAQAFWRDMDVHTHIAFYMDQGMKRMDAMKACARDRGVSKSEIYRLAEEWKQK